VTDLGAFRERLGDAVVLLDFDGTLAPIVERPEDARPLPGVGGVLASLGRRARAVWIVTGRPSALVEGLLGRIDGVHVAGLYGFEDLPPLRGEVLAAVEEIARPVAGAQVEPKGASVAVHFRNAADPDEAGDALRSRLEVVARANGLRVLAGKRVWELAPGDAGGKGDAVAGIVARTAPSAALYAGDDVADLEAFAALDRVASSVLVRKVAVLGDETPEALREAADVVVEGPAGLLELLHDL
jgi:trehalose 6-phosphate phosphatase